MLKGDRITRPAFFLTSSIQHTRGSAQCKKRRKRNKKHTDRKEESVLLSDLIVYIENLEKSSKKLLDLNSESSMVAGFNVNIGRSTAL